MGLYVGLLMFAAFFVIPANHKWSIIVYLLIKVDWLAACIALRVIGAEKPTPSRETVPLLMLTSLS